MTKPTTPSEVYKAIIDQLVDDVRLRGSGGRVAKQSFFSKAPAHQRYNDFIQGLPADKRLLLSEMLQQERDSAIHDVLATFAWWVDASDVGLTFQGEPMPTDISGMGLHGDYIGRRDGWEWPVTEFE